MKTTETAGGREVRRASEGSCPSSSGPHVPGSHSWFWPLCFIPASPRTAAPASTRRYGLTSSGQALPPTSTRLQWPLSSLTLTDILNFTYIPSHSLPHYSGFFDTAWVFVHEDCDTTAQCILVYSLPGKLSILGFMLQPVFLHHWWWAVSFSSPTLPSPGLSSSFSCPIILELWAWPSPNYFVMKGMPTRHIPMCAGICITHLTVQTLTQVGS